MSRLRANSITNKTANGAPTATNGLEVTGVCTATDFSGQSGGAADFPNGLTGTTGTFSGNLGVGGVLTYEDVTNVDSIGVITARDGLRVTGIATATAFHGDGSQLNGVSGLGTALSNTPTDVLNKFYYVNSIISIDSNTIVDPPSTAVAVYTNYSELRVEESVDLIIESGDLVPDVLDLFVS